MNAVLALAITALAVAVSPAPEPGGSFSYGDYASVLDAYVDDDGFVNYASLKKDRRALDRFAESMWTLNRDVYDAWDEPEKIAFWINAYNALTLVLIVDHYPIRSSMLRGFIWPKNSIRQIPGAWKKVEFDVMDEKITLDHIEHGILRHDFAEARIHMALVCAARSCPVLRGEPYRGDVLESQLTDQSRIFLGDPKKFAIDRRDGKVRISAIFDWFKGDFVAAYGVPEREGMGAKEAAVINFIASHVGEADRSYLLSNKISIENIHYDWTLNER